jgi:hypothetical protein
MLSKTLLKYKTKPKHYKHVNDFQINNFLAHFLNNNKVYFELKTSFLINILREKLLQIIETLKHKN